MKLIRNEVKKIEGKGKSGKVSFDTTLREAQMGSTDYILFSLSTFTSGFTSFLHPSTEFKLAEKYNVLGIVEKLLGSAFIALLIAAIAKTYLIR